MKNINKTIAFAKKETVLIVAMLLAVISAFFVTPDKAYASYIDFRTLGLLFSLMTVTEGCKGLGIFERSAKFIISKVNTAFQLSIVLVGLCFFSSMFITNDVSLLTFVPLTLTALSTLGESGSKLLIPIVVLQTIAANLGSMLTPIGNPQNLYLFGVSDMKLEDFLVLMLPFTIVAGAMLFLWTLALCKKSGKLSVKTDITAENFDTYSTKDKTKLSGYVLLFVLCLLTVARLIPWQITALCALAFSAIADRNVLKTVDYSLLLTFCGFFIFIGNMGRVEIFRSVTQQHNKRSRAFYCRCRKSDNKQRSMRYTPFRLHQQAERTYNRNEHRRPWHSYRLHGKPYILQADMPQPPPYQRQIFRIFHSRKHRFSRCNGSDCKDRILK